MFLFALAHSSPELNYKGGICEIYHLTLFTTKDNTAQIGDRCPECQKLAHWKENSLSRGDKEWVEAGPDGERGSRYVSQQGA
ncbi:hypothetical protein KOW79_008159, partial [Hemibagrus wyckioides]